MAKKIGNIGIQASIKAKKNPREEAKELAEWVESNIEQVYTSIFDKRGDFKKLSASGSARQLAARSSKYDVPMRSAARRAEIIEVYSQAWKHHFKNLRSRARSAGMGQDPKYQKFKGDGGEYLGRQKRYMTPLLLTGFLREVVFKGIKSGGNDYVDMPNMLLYGSIYVDLGAFDSKDNSEMTSAEGLVAKMIGAGVISSQEDLYDFSDFYWDKIVTVMRRVIRQDFSLALGEALDEG